MKINICCQINTCSIDCIYTKLCLSLTYHDDKSTHKLLQEIYRRFTEEKSNEIISIDSDKIVFAKNDRYIKHHNPEYIASLRNSNNVTV